LVVTAVPRATPFGGLISGTHYTFPEGLFPEGDQFRPEAVLAADLGLGLGTGEDDKVGVTAGKTAVVDFTQPATNEMPHAQP
jgi:hypothetical protein